MTDATPLNRTLDQELLTLMRGASLECLVCGEFVLKRGAGVLECPECGAALCNQESAERALQLTLPAG